MVVLGWINLYGCINRAQTLRSSVSALCPSTTPESGQVDTTWLGLCPRSNGITLGLSGRVANILLTNSATLDSTG